MTDDAEPQVIQVTTAISASGGIGSATLTVEPFRIRLVEACESVFDRIEAKSGPAHNIFAETGEILFWLYAISNHDGDPPKIAPDFRWARDNYGHGNLLREIHYTDHGSRFGSIVFGRTAYGAPPVHRWVAVTAVRAGVPDRHPKRLLAYNRFLANQPVIATLRAEFDRLIRRDPLPDKYADLDG